MYIAPIVHAMESYTNKTLFWHTQGPQSGSVEIAHFCAPFFRPAKSAMAPPGSNHGYAPSKRNQGRQSQLSKPVESKLLYHVGVQIQFHARHNTNPIGLRQLVQFLRTLADSSRQFRITNSEAPPLYPSVPSDPFDSMLYCLATENVTRRN